MHGSEGRSVSHPKAYGNRVVRHRKTTEFRTTWESRNNFELAVDLNIDGRESLHAQLLPDDVHQPTRSLPNHGFEQRYINRNDS